MRHSSSLENLGRGAFKTKELTKNIVVKASDFSTYFSLFLANSRGKDKLLSLFQYTFEFVCICGRHSNIPEHRLAYQQKKILFMLISYNLKQNISSSRKVFRLFRFFDEIKGLTKMLKTKKPFLFKVISVFTYACSISYYITDNILWSVGVLITSGALTKDVKKAWKKKKNFFSLFRVIAYLTILVYSVILQNRENDDFTQELVAQSDDSSAGQIGKKIIQGRRKTRFLMLEMILSLFRFLMLVSSLKLAGHDKLDPIFVGFCGLGSSILGFLKALFEKKIMINIDKPTTTTHQITNQQISLGKLEGVKIL